MKQLPIIFISTLLLLSACGHSAYKRQQEISDSVIETVSTEKFKNLVDSGGGIILDVRTPEEFSNGYIANAVAVNVNDSSFTEKINQLPKGKDIYVYCRSGKRSLKAADILRGNKFKRIYNLENGITEWIEKGFPVISP
jgi:rhodanese-related sulfurtransferase